jgi:glycosyltransferase involved in cell wall biosynthesis
LGVFTFLIQPSLFAHAAYSKDIIHFHVASHGSFYRKIVFFFISKLLRKKTIVHLHGGGFFEFFDKSGMTIKTLITFFFEKCTSIIVVSDYSAQQLKKRFKVNTKITLVPNSSLEFENLPTVRPTTEPNQTIFFCGTLISYKGLDDLLQAMKIVQKEITHVRLIVAGNGELPPWIQRTEELGVRDCVEFCGFVGGDKKVSLYRNSAIFCLPSHFESFGIAALEAMHCSKAVVCTNVGGLPDLVSHGENGLLSNPGDVKKLAENLITLLSNKHMLDSYGANGKIKAQKCFSSSQTFKNLVTAYKACN